MRSTSGSPAPGLGVRVRVAGIVGGALAGGLLVVVAACGGAVDRVGADLGSALALDVSSPTPSAEELGLLLQSGVEQLWIEWGSLERAAGSTRIRRDTPRPIPRGSEVVLVTRGEWASLRAADEQGLAALARQLVTKATEAEAAGALVRAVVLSLDAGEPQADDAMLLERLRGGLDGRRALGLELSRSWLAPERLPAVRKVAAGADFVVCHLYGGSATDTSAWDLDVLAASAGELDRLGRPFLVGVSTTGSLEPEAAVAGEVSRLPYEVLYQRRVLVEPAFAFEGYVRQLLDLQFRARTPLGDGVTAQPGQRWRLSRPTSGHLGQVLRRLDGLGHERYRGAVFRSLRSPDDALAVPLAELVAVLRGEPTALPLELSLEVVRRGGEAQGVIGLANPGAATAAALVDHNLVEIRIENGSFGGIEPGPFHRFELLDESGQRAPLRLARRLRLYFRFLERGERLASGTIRWTAGSGTRVTATARQLTVTGEVLESVSAGWPAPAGGAAPAPGATEATRPRAGGGL